jgi:hypothetical protein
MVQCGMKAEFLSAKPANIKTEPARQDEKVLVMMPLQV